MEHKRIGLPSWKRVLACLLSLYLTVMSMPMNSLAASVSGGDAGSTSDGNLLDDSTEDGSPEIGDEDSGSAGTGDEGSGSTYMGDDGTDDTTGSADSTGGADVSGEGVGASDGSGELSVGGVSDGSGVPSVSGGDELVQPDGAEAVPPVGTVPFQYDESTGLFRASAAGSDGVSVEMTYAPGVFPAYAVMEAKEITAPTVLDKIDQALNQKIEGTEENDGAEETEGAEGTGESSDLSEEVKEIVQNISFEIKILVPTVVQTLEEESPAADVSSNEVGAEEDAAEEDTAEEDAAEEGAVVWEWVEVQPDLTVGTPQVAFTGAPVQEAIEDSQISLEVFHVANSETEIDQSSAEELVPEEVAAEVTVDEEQGQVAFEAEHFSVYVLRLRAALASVSFDSPVFTPTTNTQENFKIGTSNYFNLTVHIEGAELENPDLVLTIPKGISIVYPDATNMDVAAKIRNGASSVKKSTNENGDTTVTYNFSSNMGVLEFSIKLTPSFKLKDNSAYSITASLGAAGEEAASSNSYEITVQNPSVDPGWVYVYPDYYYPSTSAILENGSSTYDAAVPGTIRTKGTDYYPYDSMTIVNPVIEGPQIGYKDAGGNFTALTAASPHTIQYYGTDVGTVTYYASWQVYDTEASYTCPVLVYQLNSDHPLVKGGTNYYYFRDTLLGSLVYRFDGATVRTDLGSSETYTYAPDRLGSITAVIDGQTVLMDTDESNSSTQNAVGFKSYKLSDYFKLSGSYGYDLNTASNVFDLEDNTWYTSSLLNNTGETIRDIKVEYTFDADLYVQRLKAFLSTTLGGQLPTAAAVVYKTKNGGETEYTKNLTPDDLELKLEDTTDAIVWAQITYDSVGTYQYSQTILRAYVRNRGQKTSGYAYAKGTILSATAPESLVTGGVIGTQTQSSMMFYLAMTQSITAPQLSLSKTALNKGDEFTLKFYASISNYSYLSDNPVFYILMPKGYLFGGYTPPSNISAPYTLTTKDITIDETISSQMGTDGSVRYAPPGEYVLYTITYTGTNLPTEKAHTMRFTVGPQVDTSAYQAKVYLPTQFMVQQDNPSFTYYAYQSAVDYADMDQDSDTSEKITNCNNRTYAALNSSAGLTTAAYLTSSYDTGGQALSKSYQASSTGTLEYSVTNGLSSDSMSAGSVVLTMPRNGKSVTFSGTTYSSTWDGILTGSPTLTGSFWTGAVISYSNDDGSTYTYDPTANAEGYGAVTQVKVTSSGSTTLATKESAAISLPFKTKFDSNVTASTNNAYFGAALDYTLGGGTGTTQAKPTTLSPAPIPVTVTAFRDYDGDGTQDLEEMIEGNAYTTSLYSGTYESDKAPSTELKSGSTDEATGVISYSGSTLGVVFAPGDYSIRVEKSSSEYFPDTLPSGWEIQSGSPNYAYYPFTITDSMSQLIVTPLPIVSPRSLILDGFASGEYLYDGGSPRKIIADVFPALGAGESITFTSSDQTVVQVDGSGNLTYVGDGTATITVSMPQLPSLVGRFGSEPITKQVIVNTRKQSYTVTLHAGTGGTLSKSGVTSVGSGNYTASYIPGTAYTLPTAAESVPASVQTYFEGWYENENFTGSKVSKISASSYGNKEYWAKWETYETKYETAEDTWAYGTFAKAVNQTTGVMAGGQIVLLKDVSTSSNTLYKSAAILTDGTARTLDLGTSGYLSVNGSTTTLTINDEKLTITGAYYTYGTVRPVTSGATVLLKAGTIANTGSGAGIYSSTSGTSIQVTGGAVSAASGYGINNGSSGTVTITEGTVSSVSSRAIYNSTSGAVNIEGGTISSDASSAIANSGTLTIDGGTISADAAAAITNSGTLDVDGGAVSSATGSGIANTGTVNVDGGKVSSTSEIGIKNTNYGKVNVLSGTVSSSSSHGIGNMNYGTVTVEGGSVSSTSGNGIYNSNTGSVTIKGGTISSAATDKYAIYNLGSSVTIEDGTIKNTAGIGLFTSSSVTVSGGTISGKTYGVRSNYVTVSLSGAPAISGEDADIYLYGTSALLAFPEALTGASTYTLATDSYSVGKVLSTATTVADYSARFVSADTTYHIGYNSAKKLFLQKVVTITPTAGLSKVYGENDPTFTYTQAPGATITGSLSGTLSRVSGSDVGTYAYTLGSLAASSENYYLALASPSPTFAITQKTIAIPTIGDKTYNGSSQGHGLSATDAYTLSAESGDKAAAVNAGTYSITATLTSTTNYKWSDSTTAAKSIEWKILTKAITVVPQDAARKVGEANPTFTLALATGSTLAGSDTLAYAAGTPTYACEAVASSATGDYDITITNLSSSSSNYAITYTGASSTGTLTVTQDGVKDGDYTIVPVGYQPGTWTDQGITVSPAGSYTKIRSTVAGSSWEDSVTVTDDSVSLSFELKTSTGAITTAKTLSLKSDTVAPIATVPTESVSTTTGVMTVSVNLTDDGNSKLLSGVDTSSITLKQGTTNCDFTLSGSTVTFTRENTQDYTLTYSDNVGNESTLTIAMNKASYTLSFVPGTSSEGDVPTGSSPASQSLWQYKQVTLPANPYSLAGWYFTGWKATVGGVEKIYQPGDTFTMPGAGVTMTAVWEYGEAKYEVATDTWAYGTLAQALADVMAGGRICLQQDVTASSNITIAKSITFMTDGVVNSAELNMGTNQLQVTDGTLSIHDEDLVITGANATNSTLAIGSGAQASAAIVLAAGTVQNTKAGSGISLAKGSLTVSGGILDSKEGAGLTVTGGTLVINGGEIKGATYAIYANEAQEDSGNTLQLSGAPKLTGTNADIYFANAYRLLAFPAALTGKEVYTINGASPNALGALSTANGTDYTSKFESVPSIWHIGYVSDTKSSLYQKLVWEKVVTITPASAQSKVYGEDDPLYTYEAALQGTKTDSEDIGITGALGRASGENVGIYAYTLGTLVVPLGNYLELAAGATTFGIREKQISIPVIADETYNGTTQEHGLTDKTEYTISIETGDTEEATGVGTYSVTATLTDTLNYQWTDQSTTPKVISWKIAPKSIVVVPTNVEKKVGEANPTFTLKLASGSTLAGTDTIDAAGAPTFACAATTASAVGNYDITITALGAGSGNYTVTYTGKASTGTLKISQDSITPTDYAFTPVGYEAGTWVNEPITVEPAGSYVKIRSVSSEGVRGSWEDDLSVTDEAVNLKFECKSLTGAISLPYTVSLKSDTKAPIATAPTETVDTETGGITVSLTLSDDAAPGLLSGIDTSNVTLKQGTTDCSFTLDEGVLQFTRENAQDYTLSFGDMAGNKSTKTIALTKNLYTLSFAPGTNTEEVVPTGTAPSSLSLWQYQQGTLPANTFTLVGWYFIGWKTASGDLYQPGDAFTMAGENTTLTAVWKEYEAKYETAQDSWVYGSFLEALENAVSDGEIRLLQDVTVDTSLTITKAVTLATDGEGEKRTLQLEDKGKITITNGTLTMKDDDLILSAETTAVILDGGNFTISGAAQITAGTEAITVKDGTASVSGTAQITAGTDAITIEDGTVNVSGTPQIKAEENAIIVEGGTANVSGTAQITAGTDAITIEDGTVNVSDTPEIEAEENAIIVKGGTANVSGTAQIEAKEDAIVVDGGTANVSGTPQIAAGNDGITVLDGEAVIGGSPSITAEGNAINWEDGELTLSSMESESGNYAVGGTPQLGEVIGGADTKESAAHFVSADPNWRIGYGTEEEGDHYQELFWQQVVTIVPDAEQSKRYGAADPVFTYKAYLDKTQKDPSDIGLQGALTRTAGESVGTYGYQLGSLVTDTDVYALSMTTTPPLFTINKKILNIPVIGDKTYNGTLQAGLENAEGYRVKAGENDTVSAGDAGNYTLTAELTDTANYQWADDSTSPKNIAWKILPLEIAVAPQGVIRKAGQENPGFTLVLVDGSTLAGEDTLFGATGIPTFACEADEESLAGTYPITITALPNSNPNYQIVYDDPSVCVGTLTITQAQAQTTDYIQTPVGSQPGTWATEELRITPTGEYTKIREIASDGTKGAWQDYLSVKDEIKDLTFEMRDLTGGFTLAKTVTLKSDTIQPESGEPVITANPDTGVITVNVTLSDTVSGLNESSLTLTQGDTNIPFEILDGTLSFTSEKNEPYTLTVSDQAGNVKTTQINVGIPYYTLSYAPGETVTSKGQSPEGTSPGSRVLWEGRKIQLPDNPYIFEGYIFCGWSYEGELYAPGDTFKMPGGDAVLQAVWVVDQISDVSGTVIFQNGKQVVHGQLKLYEDGLLIQQEESNGSGKFKFKKLPNKAYDLEVVISDEVAGDQVQTFKVVAQDELLLSGEDGEEIEQLVISQPQVVADFTKQVNDMLPTWNGEDLKENWEGEDQTAKDELEKLVEAVYQEIMDMTQAYDQLSQVQTNQFFDETLEKWGQLLSIAGNITLTVEDNSTLADVSNIDALVGLLITEEDLLKQAESKQDIKIVFQIKDVDQDVENDRIKKSMALLTLHGGQQQSVVRFFEVTIRKIVGDETTEINETPKEVELMFWIPEDMRDGIDYQILRDHQNIITGLLTRRMGNYLFAYSSQFSTYAIAYTPNRGGSEDGNTEESEILADSPIDVSSPKTAQRPPVSSNAWMIPPGSVSGLSRRKIHAPAPRRRKLQ
jgi:hypothetical protein